MIASVPDMPADIDLLHAARCEDLQYAEIKELSVEGDFERKTINTLKGSGAHLLQGARGMGKSMLLRLAEIELVICQPILICYTPPAVKISNMRRSKNCRSKATSTDSSLISAY